MKGFTGSSRRRNIILAGACLAGGVAAAIPQASRAALLANVAFNDALATNGSTLGAAAQSYPNAASPTATSTNYDVASSKNATTSALTSGSPLQLTIPATTGGVSEVQALFTSTPIVLSTIGQSIELTTTFKNTAGLNLNSSSSVDIGLYNSGGSSPYNNLYNASTGSPVTGITGNQIQENTGGVAGWVGYESDYFGTSSTKVYTRPAQLTTTTNNVDQALVVDGQTGGVQNPAGTQATYTGQNSTASVLTVGNTYTDELSITLSATGVYTLTEALYNGTSDTGTEVGTTTTGTLSSLPSGGFDGLAIGYRESDNVAAEMDISSVEVTTNVPIPEPVSFGILSVAGLGLLRRKRRV